MKLHAEGEISSTKKKDKESKRKSLLNRKKNVKINADLSYKNVLKGPQGEMQDFI